MGVPKFFRYISERYPCLSELVKDYQIPEFDNLYLDMNGIIHNCSHPNDDDPHFRITEEKIFKDIFHYIEVLFRMIKPQKLFFMAVDGVAPRAKMNQQRGRRFRSADDAAKAEAEAIKKGESLPTEARFDSNCITPGTVFMAKLHEQLKYFVVDKISNDPLWQKCKVILSGHETPGEGEHKIMDYIRYMRAQQGYDPNTRHCLYGLDADLIMLGLCTHEPHFSLLREEVKFGKKSTKRITVPEEITFFLLHLSLLREYLELEFAPIKYNLKGFHYDLEKIIDDWVLMGFLVGNDFIPHLPNLHISEGALPILYKTYMEVLPMLDGYINEAGTLNLKRFEVFLEKLGMQDVDYYEQVKDDIMYLEMKRGNKGDALTRELEEWEAEDDNAVFEALEPEKPVSIAKDSGLASLLKSADDLCLDDDNDNTSYDDFANFKKDYYKEKMEFMEVTPQVLRDQAVGYVRAIQWNLNYYYNGCCSWSWFYPHHYAPYISDIKGFTDLNIEFDMGKPFLPYEQLLAVLPAASKQLLPECYHNLMTAENSIIIHYYPQKFECDLNGKKQSWEAVVKIPFIDETLLLEAMSYCNDHLTTEEKRRNSHGPMLIYMYTPRNNGPYPAPCYFPEVPKNHTELRTLLYKDVLVPQEKLVKGAYPGAHMNVYYPGFPTMKHLKYKGELHKAHVKVFEQPSRNESMIIQIIPDVNLKGDMIPVDLLGTSVFIGWPHLIEAKVVSISNSNRKYVSMGGPNQYNTLDLRDSDKKQFLMSLSGCTELYKNRLGIIVGETKVLVYVKQMIGKKFNLDANGKLSLEKQFAQNTSCYPLQTVVYNITAHDPQSNMVKDVESIFPKNSICFTLTNPYYGSQGVIQESAQVTKTGRIKISISVLEEPDLRSIRELQDNVFRNYKTINNVATPLCISNVLFSKITGSIHVRVSHEPEAKKMNIGLDLKLNKRNKETPGYTKKVNNYWLYTEKAADLVNEYIEKFPEVLDFLSRNNDYEDVMYTKLFPVKSDERFKELQQWLKTLPTHSVEKQPCNSVSLEPDSVEELEKIVDSFKTGNVKKVTMQVKPNLLYRPEVQTGTLEPDPKTETQILDRIVNVRHGYSVPFGFKGTVTAIRTSTTNNARDTMYEVVFDKPFRDGLKLNCSENRGYMLPKTAFINISYGQRLMIEKTGRPGELIAKAEATYSNPNTNYNNYFNNLIKPQPQAVYQHKQANPSQQLPCPPFFLPPPPNQQPINQQNSAFAHFSSTNSYRKPQFEKQFAQDNEQSDHGNSSAMDDEEKVTNKEENDPYRSEGNNYQKLMKPEDFRQPPQKYAEEKWKQPPHKTNFDQGHRNKGYQQERNKSNSFMPDFGQNDRKHKDKQSRITENPQPNFESKPSHMVNTDFLKNILGIGKDENNKEILSTNATENKENVVNVPSKQVSERPPNVVNTDFLKNILGIGKEEKKEEEESSTKRTVVANSGNVIPSNKTGDEIKSSNVSFDMLEQVAKTPASVRLLTYYQSNQLGLPRYQYFPVENNMVKAQITLNDGRLIIGEPAESREDASENVATVVLKEFIKKGKSPEVIDNHENIPAPPTNWVQSGNKKNNAEKASKVKPLEPGAALSFVPLQALKNHISKASSSNSSSSSNVKQNEVVKEVASTNGKQETNVTNNTEVVNKTRTTSNATKNRPKKERRTRIAARFQK